MSSLFPSSHGFAQRHCAGACPWGQGPFMEGFEAGLEVLSGSLRLEPTVALRSPRAYFELTGWPGAPLIASVQLVPNGTRCEGLGGLTHVLLPCITLPAIVGSLSPGAAQRPPCCPPTSRPPLPCTSSAAIAPRPSRWTSAARRRGGSCFVCGRLWGKSR